MRYVFALGVFTVLVAGGQPAYAAKPDCEPFRCAVETAVAARCPCNLGVPAGTVAANHGQYVSCVAKAVRDLAKAGTIPNNCKGKITRCAARSICGKGGFVTCQVPVPGRCDPATGTCVKDKSVACLTDADCTGTRCKIKSSADLCTAADGIVGTSGSCCADCGG
jgi:hypothetical protein